MIVGSAIVADAGTKPRVNGIFVVGCLSWFLILNVMRKTGAPYATSGLHNYGSRCALAFAIFQVLPEQLSCMNLLIGTNFSQEDRFKGDASPSSAKIHVPVLPAAPHCRLVERG